MKKPNKFMMKKPNKFVTSLRSKTDMKFRKDWKRLEKINNNNNDNKKTTNRFSRNFSCPDGAGGRRNK